MLIKCEVGSLLAKDGYATLASLTAKMKLRLYKIRPKLHMMGHIQSLSMHVLRLRNQNEAEIFIRSALISVCV